MEEEGKDPNPTTSAIPRPVNPLDLPSEKLPLGCPVLTRLLSGGVPIGSVTELAGESGSGKTQLCLQLLLSLPSPSYLSLFLHTESPFPLRRLLSLLGPNYQNAPPLDSNYQNAPPLDRVFVRPSPSPEDLLSLLHSLPRRNYRSAPVRLLVVDSIAALFRSDSDASALPRRSALLFRVAAELKSLARDLRLAVLVTNHVADVIGGDDAAATRAMVSSGRRVSPALGMSWANCVNTRLFLSRTEDGRRRRMHVVFAPHLPPSSAEFVILREGVFGVDRSFA